MASSRRAFSLGSVLVAALALTLLAIAVGAAASSHLLVGNRLVNQSAARNLAESAIAFVLKEIKQDPQYGTAGHAGASRVFRWPAPDDPQFAGLATFDSEQAAALGIPPSKNNLGADAPVPGWRRDIPKQTVQIVAMGSYCGITETVEVLYHVPVYSEVITSSGTVATHGSTLIARVTDSSVLLGGLAALTPSAALPGDVVANGSGMLLSVTGSTNVTGDAVAVGQVSVVSPATVRNKREHATARTITPLNLASYNPGPPGSSGAKSGLQVLSTANLDPGPLSGYVMRSGELDVAGPLSLAGGLLYVTGNLTIHGPITGKGAVIVRGKLAMEAGASFSSDNVVALASGGGIKMAGASKDGSFFRGLIYTEGDFSAQNITVVGSVVANGPSGSVVNITDAAVLGEKLAVDFTVQGYAKYNMVARLPGLELKLFYVAAPGTTTPSSIVYPGTTNPLVTDMSSLHWVGNTASNVPLVSPLPLLPGVPYPPWSAWGKGTLTMVPLGLTDVKVGTGDSFHLDVNQILASGSQSGSILWKRQ